MELLNRTTRRSKPTDAGIRYSERGSIFLSSGQWICIRLS
ncbi:hypothetical protein [Paraburkholderia caribensis]